MTQNTPHSAAPAPLGMLAVRSCIGGVFMGLANLVPGISGGTMLLAVGVYPEFINAIAELTTLKPTRRSLMVLGLVAAAALAAIAAFASLITFLVIDFRWAMYSLFIGLTLGGVPIVWKLIRKPTPAVWAGAAVGFIGMALLALAQASGVATAGDAGDGFIFLLIAGVAGASAMILPGVSGAYLLLVLGVYLTITASIRDAVSLLKAGDLAAAMPIGLHVLLPVAIGVVVGVVLVSNLLRFLLKRYEKATLGFLLGLLVGAVVGLWPFQQAVPPDAGMKIKGKTVVVQTIERPESLSAAAVHYIYEENHKPVEEKDWPTVFFTPSVTQIGLALLLLAAGFGVTLAVAQLDRSEPSEHEA